MDWTRALHDCLKLTLTLETLKAQSALYMWRSMQRLVPVYGTIVPFWNVSVHGNVPERLGTFHNAKREGAVLIERAFKGTFAVSGSCKPVQTQCRLDCSGNCVS